MKKIITTLLALSMLVLTVGFAACSGGGTSSPSSDTPPQSGSTGEVTKPEEPEPENYYPVLEVYTNATRIMKGQTFHVEPVVTYGGVDVEAVFTYSSDNDEIVSVDAQGVASGVGAGTATIKVSCTYNGVSLEKSVSITVQNAYSFAFLDEEVTVGTFGDTNKATAAYYLYENDEPLENADIDWTIGDEAIATVDAQGVITGVAYGETMLFAEFEDIEISIPVKCYIPAYEGEINNFNHISRMDNVLTKNMTTEAVMASELISEAVGGKTPTNGNFLKFAATKTHTYPALYLNPMVTKADLEELADDGATSIKFSIYIEKVDTSTERRLLKKKINGTETSILQVVYGEWTDVSIALKDIINNYDRYASYIDPLFFIPNTGSTTDILLIPSAFNVYLDAITVDVPTYTHYTISSVADFWKINNDMSETAYYTLTQDLDFSAHAFNYDTTITDGSWHSIGWNADANQYATFKGVLDGNGFALKNITLRGYNYTHAIYAAVFGITDGATFKNLYVDMEMASESGANTAKLVGFIGNATNTTVKNCFVRFKTNQTGYGSNFNGPIMSHSNGGTIENCVSILDVSDGFISSNKTNIGSVFGLAHGSTTYVTNTYAAMLLQDGDTQPLKINGSGSPSVSGSSVSATVAKVYEAISATGVLTKENGWNTNVWKIENNALKFGDETIYSAQ